MLTLRRALALGALHGPAELLPVSSSGHLTAIPWLLGWDYDTLEPELRKAFEVTLHAGTAAALLLSLHEEIEPKGLVLMVSATAPPAAAGLVFERAIERHAGTPPAIAAGLVVGSAAILLSERAPSARGIEDAGVVDALWLGLAETLALLPGVSRSGATLAAARFLRFRRADAQLLSAQIALPVIAGAAALKGLRLLRDPPAAGLAARLAAGGSASFVSTLIARRLIGTAAGARSTAPYAIYRLALAGLILGRLRRDARARPSARARA